MKVVDDLNVGDKLFRVEFDGVDINIKKVEILSIHKSKDPIIITEHGYEKYLYDIEVDYTTLIKHTYMGRNVVIPGLPYTMIHMYSGEACTCGNAGYFINVDDANRVINNYIDDESAKLYKLLEQLHSNRIEIKEE